MSRMTSEAGLGLLSTPLTVLRSEASGYYSTAFNRILTCVMPDGSERRVMLKRGKAKREVSCGHRGGVPYEAEIYRRVLPLLGISRPEFVAAETDPLTGETTLLIGLVEDYLRLDESEIDVVIEAAEWIGNFHRVAEPRAREFSEIVVRYDASYYLNWQKRALRLNRDGDAPWLPALCARFPELVEEILALPATLIHGEYYPHNILTVDSSIVPVDWESAAIGIGEIDLESLVEAWPDVECQRFRSAYQRARWPEGVPDDVQRRHTLAGIYWSLRWLVDPAEEGSAEQLLRLKLLAEEVGVL